MDNRKLRPFIAVIKYLEGKYGIKRIGILAYNSKVNGKMNSHIGIYDKCFIKPVAVILRNKKTSCITFCGKTELLFTREWVLTIFISHRSTFNIAFGHTEGGLASKITRKNSDHKRIN